MKKILSIALLVVMLATIMTGVVSAATTAESVDAIYAIGSKYGMTSADKVKLERFIADYDVTEDQASQLLAKAQEAEKIMIEAGVTNYSDLTAEQKNQIKSIANEAASIVGVTLTFKKGAVEIYKDGKLIETITNTDGKLAYTGNETNVVLIASSVVAVIALTAVIIKKRTAVA